MRYLKGLLAGPLVATFDSLVAEESEAVSVTLSYPAQFAKMLFVLALLVVCIWYSYRVLRKMTGRRLLYGNSSHTIKILERRPLSPKTSLYLIEVGGKGLVISESPAGVHSVAEVPIDAILDEEGGYLADKQPAGKSFSDVLKSKIMGVAAKS